MGFFLASVLVPTFALYALYFSGLQNGCRDLLSGQLEPGLSIMDNLLGEILCIHFGMDLGHCLNIFIYWSCYGLLIWIFCWEKFCVGILAWILIEHCLNIFIDW